MNTQNIRVYVFWFASCIICAPLLAQSSLGSARKKEDPICGAKCLYVILRGYGKAPNTYKSVTEELGPPPAEGYSLLQLRDVARKHELFAESVQLDKETLARFANSCSVILHLSKVRGTDRDHYVICEGVTPTSTTIFDATAGMPSQMSHEIFSLWSGNTLIVSKKPIDLASKPSPHFWKAYLGMSFLSIFCLIGIVYFSRFLRSRWLINACLLVAVISPFGCTPKRESGVPLRGESSGATTQDASQALPSVASGLWVEKTVCNAGTLRQASAPVIVPVKIYNSEKVQITITDVRFTCGCLYASFSSFDIPPQESIECNLRLDCQQIGLRNATAIMLTDKNEQVSIEANWNVVASMKTEPETFGGIELKSGESAEASAHLTQLEPFDFSKLEIKSLLAKQEVKSFFSASARIDGETILATFKTNKDSPTGLVTGNFLIGLPGDEVVSVKIPFTVYVANDIDVSPEKVFFTKKDNKLSAQVLLFTSDVGHLDPTELTWIGPIRTKCEFTILDEQDTRIVNITISPEAVGKIQQVEVSVAGGKFLKLLPVYFP